jgi:hypothetical protein
MNFSHKVSSHLIVNMWVFRLVSEIDIIIIIVAYSQSIRLTFKAVREVWKVKKWPDLDSNAARWSWALTDLAYVYMQSVDCFRDRMTVCVPCWCIRGPTGKLCCFHSLLHPFLCKINETCSPNRLLGKSGHTHCLNIVTLHADSNQCRSTVYIPPPAS